MRPLALPTMRLPLLDKLMQGPERRFSRRASRLLDRGKGDQAADVLRAGLEKLPESIDLHVALVRLLLLGGHHPAGLEEVDHLLASKPAGPEEVRRLVEMCALRGLPTAGLHHALVRFKVHDSR